MAKKSGSVTSRRRLAAKYLQITEEEILASRETEDGGIVVVLESGPKVKISGDQLRDVNELEEQAPTL